MTSSISSSNEVCINKKRRRGNRVDRSVEQQKRRRAESSTKDLGDMCWLFNMQAVQLLMQLFYEMINEKKEAGSLFKIKFEVKEWEIMTTKFNDKLKQLGACRHDFAYGQVRTKLSIMKSGKCSDLKTIMVTDPELWTKWEVCQESTDFSRASTASNQSQPEIASARMGIDKDAEKLLKGFKLPVHVCLAGYNLFKEDPTITQILNIVPAKERKSLFYMHLAEAHMEEMEFDNATRAKALNMVSNCPIEAEAFMRCRFLVERREYILKRLSELYPPST